MVKFFVCISPCQRHKKKNVSNFPDCVDKMQWILRNQVIYPRTECLSEVPLHALLCKLGGQKFHEKSFVEANQFFPLIQFCD